MNSVEILVLDFGSQYTQLIARRLREYGVYTEIVPYFEKIDSIRAKRPKGIILSGGPASVYEEGAYKPDSAIFSLGIPVLGICYGMQYIADFFGGRVVKAEAQEFGKAVLEILDSADSKNVESTTKTTSDNHLILETPRLILREFVESDFESLHKILSDERVMSAWGHGFSESETQEWLDRQFERYNSDGFGSWAMIERDSGELIGNAGVNYEMISLEGKDSRRIVEIGYILAKDSWGKGYGLEAANACKAYAFNTIGVKSVYCLVKDDNFSSMRLARKLGMRLVGENMKHYKGADLRHYIFSVKHSELVFGVDSVLDSTHNPQFRGDSRQKQGVDSSVESANAKITLQFSKCDDKDSVFSSWQSGFGAAHSFMEKSMIDEITNHIKGAMSRAESVIVVRGDKHSVAFGLLGDSNLGKNHFELYPIHSAKSASKLDYSEILRQFFRYILGQNLLDSTFITSKWDRSDERGFMAYLELGFVAVGEILKASEEVLRTNLGLKSPKIQTPHSRDLKNHGLFSGVKRESIVWMSHADKVEQIPQGFVELAKSGNTHYCAIADLERKIYALQFHPEVVHSECGGEILQNFAIGICGSDTSWNMHNFVENEIKKIREIAKDGKILCAVSGGVDSSVVATLLYRAIGERLVPVFVDTGLLRLGEREAVEAMFRENLGVPLITIDASEIFLGRLKGVVEPESKRKIIGETFIEVFETEAKRHNANGEIKFLAQGTLYPDVIESVSVKGPSKTIKSHHNVGGLPEWMKFELIEPLRELFKDEVRELGRELGMPESMLMRHPFPGPGLAIRIMGEVNRADLELLKRVDSIFIEELHDKGFYNSVWQAFCVLLNVKSVGVMGDNRTYDNTICVRAVEALDGMTATFAYLPHDFLENVANRIINEVEGINRVVYDITSKPPGTIEWE